MNFYIREGLQWVTIIFLWYSVAMPFCNCVERWTSKDEAQVCSEGQEKEATHE